MTEYTKLIELVVNESTRIIAIPNDNIVLGVVGDIEVNKLMFKMSRYYCGFDMSEFTPKINYVTPNAEGNYYKSELEVTDDVITFTWLLTSDVTEYNGTVKFSISLYKKENGRVLKAFNSRSSVGNVLEGLNVDTYVTPEQQQTILDRLETEIREDIQSFVTEKSDAAIKAIDTKKNDVLSTIAEKESSTNQQITEKSDAAIKAIDTKKNDVLSTISEDQYIQKIEQNTANVTSLKEDLTSKADKTSLAQTDRKLDALWKLNQGISYKFEEDSEAAYQKEVPSGAKLASVKQIGGKTIVWNQLLNCDALKADLSRMYDVTNDDGIYTLIAKGIRNRAQQTIQVKQNHIYLMKAVTNEVDGNSVEFCPHSYGNAMANMAQCYNKGEGWKRIYQIIKAGYTGGLLFQFYLHASEYPATMQYKAGSFQVFDLTQMFGAGNEPSTVEAFEAMFPEDYYSYNEGELLSAGVNEIVEHGRNLIDARKVVSKTSDVNFENLGNGKIHVYGSTDTRSEIDPVYVDEKDFPPGQYRINVIGISGISVTFVKKNKATGEKTWCNDKFEITDNDTPLYWYVMAVKCTVDIVITPQITAGDTELPTLVYHDPVSFAIPEAVRQLPGYGWSAGNIYNEIDFENKKYIQRVAAIDFGKLTFAQYDPTNHTKHTWYTKVSNMRPTSAKLTCAKYTQHSWISMDDKTFLQGIIQSHPSLNYIYISDDDYTNASDFSKAVSGVMLYYELAEPIITDISDIVGDTFQEPFEVEAGGTLTFQNSHGDDYRIPVSSTEEYLISLAEVAK